MRNRFSLTVQLAVATVLLFLLGFTNGVHAQSGARASAAALNPRSAGRQSDGEAATRASAARNRPAATLSNTGGSGTRSAGSSSRSAGSGSRAPSSRSAPSRATAAAGSFRASPITVAPSAAPRSTGLSRGGPSFSSAFSSRSPFNRSPAQQPRSLVPLSMATPPQYLKHNGAHMPTGHSTGSQFFSHYYPIR